MKQWFLHCVCMYEEPCS